MFEQLKRPPCLPLELERIIFEMSSYAGDEYHQHLLNLMLVARYVHDWIKPILYNTYLQSPKTRIPDVRRFPSVDLEVVGKYSRNLLLGEEMPRDQIVSILELCPSVDNLAVWTTRTDLAHLQDEPAFCALKLKKLSAFVSDLRAIHFTIGSNSGPVFAWLTHLEIIRTRRETWEAWAPLAALPSLTHLLVNAIIPDDISAALLEHCGQRLVCLIQLVSVYVVDRLGTDERAVLCGSDLRMVSLTYTCAFHFIRDWHDGVRGIMDNWARGEAVCCARRNKYFVDPTPRWLPCDAELWTSELTEAGKTWYAML